MPNMRRGFPPGVLAAVIRFAAAANAGVMASRSGNESRMPAPRRNLRRERAGRVETKGASLVLAKVVFMGVMAANEQQFGPKVEAKVDQSRPSARTGRVRHHPRPSDFPSAHRM